MDFKYGELINEDQVSPDGRGSTGPFVQGHYPEENGFTANLLPAQTDQTSGTILSSVLFEQLNY